MIGSLTQNGACMAHVVCNMTLPNMKFIGIHISFQMELY